MSTRYTTLTYFQVFLLALLTGFIAGAVVLAYTQYTAYRVLPQVVSGADGKCVKVVNFENGHAFGCPDVDVLLRRYRPVSGF